MRNLSPFVVTGALFVAALLAVNATVSHAAPDEDAAKLFKARCSVCHGLDGKGDTTAGKAAGVKNWTDGKTLAAMTDAQIEERIRTGIKADDGKERMPPFPRLSDDQVKALRAHVRSLSR
jgi:mono/diheme cytochrome c family protein